MVNIIYKSFIKEDSVDKAIELYKILVEESRKQNGCIRYELYQHASNKTILTIEEEWASDLALKDHAESDIFKKIVGEISTLTAKDAEMDFYAKLA